MLPLVLDCGIGVLAVWSLKYVHIYKVLLVWLGLSVVRVKFGGSYSLVRGYILQLCTHVEVFFSFKFMVLKWMLW